MSKAKEEQNQVQFDNYNKNPVSMGVYASHIWRTDPKHIGFLFSRYKAVSKLLQGKKKCLEVGCGDCIGTPVILQTVESVHAVDFEPLLLESNQKRVGENFKNITFGTADLTKENFNREYDSCFLLDVIEHIPKDQEEVFFNNIAESVDDDAVVIIGSPNLTSQVYASECSKKGHVNCKTYEEFQQILKKYFKNGFVLGLNDEMVHLGFGPFCNYLMGVGIGPKRQYKLKNFPPSNTINPTTHI